jgi:hypothetical protein
VLVLSNHATTPFARRFYRDTIGRRNSFRVDISFSLLCGNKMLRLACAAFLTCALRVQAFGYNYTYSAPLIGSGPFDLYYAYPLYTTMASVPKGPATYDRGKG